MADNFSQSSFIVPATPEQTQIFFEALEVLKSSEDHGNAAIETLLKKPEAELSPMENIVQMCWALREDADDEKHQWNFECEPDKNGIWVYSNEYINSEHAAIFIHAFLASMDSSVFVGIEVAHTCSKLRLDEFGGHSIAVTKDFIRYAPRFLSSEEDAHCQGLTYFLHDNQLLVINKKEDREKWQASGAQEIEPFAFSVMKSYFPVK